MRELQFGQLKLLDENKVEIDSDFKKPGTIQPGDTIEFDRYIVEVSFFIVEVPFLSLC